MSRLASAGSFPRTRGVAFVAALAAGAIAAAHHGPDEVVAELSTRIAAGEEASPLLLRRAQELRVLGRTDEAIADYRRVLAARPGDLAATLGLAKTLNAIGRHEEALAALRPVTMTAPEPVRPSYHAVAAAAHEALGEDQRAVAAWEAAIAGDAPQVDWLVAHAATLRRLGRPAQARAALAAAVDRNPSEVIRRAWIESLIDGGDAERARELVQEGLARARWRSYWLVLRARLLADAGRYVAAGRDVDAAITELDNRLAGGAPNPLLRREREAAAALRRRLAALQSDAAPPPVVVH